MDEACELGLGLGEGGVDIEEVARTHPDRVIREGKVDLVAIGRAMLASPEWAADARKVLAAL